MADTPNLIRATVNLPQVLVAQHLSPSVEVVYQVPTAKAVAVATATLCNTSGATRTAVVHVVKAAQSPTTANRIAIIELLAGESCVVEGLVGVLMGPGDAIAADGGAASAVSMVITGAVSS